MILESDDEKNWLNEFEKFISHWEEETEKLKVKSLDLEECCKISDVFHKEWDELLIKRPEGISNDIILKFERLDNKLSSVLAMVCSCAEENST
jgi:hypothetical protein